jgi:CHAT domain-containing protein
VVADPGHEDTETLPMSIAEARTIVSLAGQPERVSALLGPQATREAVRHAVGDAGVIHFGCHGLFRPALPLDSELQLAADDIITVADVFSGGVDLRGAQLVSLLACETAAGDAHRVPDECLTFPTAVLIGGALAAVSTMWPVDDAAAALFTVRFHELVQQGMRPAEAVVTSRAWLRSATTDELLRVVERMRSALTDADAGAAAALDELATDLAHPSSAYPFGEPYLWAPFVLTGG